MKKSFKIVEKNENLVLIAVIILSLFVGFLDFYTGPELSFSLFYLIPVVIVTWFMGRVYGIFLSMFCILVFYFVEFYSETYSNILPYIWNAAVRWIFYIIIVYLLSELKGTLKRSEGLVEELKESLEREKELNELKTNFVSMISHEFRTPLSLILTSSEILEAYEKTLSAEEKRENFDTINTEIKNLINMLNNVLLLGKIEAKKKKFNPEPTYLKSFCQDIANKISRVKNYKINFIYTGSTGEVLVDRRLFMHIITNLLDNAIKYSGEAGEMLFRVSNENGNIILSFEDKGIGIPIEDMKNLFEQFYRGSNIENISGTGLGLFIAKSSAELHGGSIKVDSSLNYGTKFTVIIPVLKESKADEKNIDN